jgi:tryptophan synthase alpha subunit
MQTLGRAIKERAQAGYLGLVPCIIPGFPDLDASLQITKFLDASEAVTALEFTLPAAQSFSDTANQTIIDANRQASRFIAGRDLKMWLQTQTANFIMFYREAVDRVGFEPLAKQFTETCRGIALEWDEPELQSYWDICHRAGIELIIGVNPEMTEEELTFFSQFILPEGIVYLSSARQAGGERYPLQRIETCARSIKTRLPNTAIVAAQGIYTPADVRQMAAIAEIDAVVIGTGFFHAAQKGLPAIRAYLKTIEPELSRRV